MELAPLAMKQKLRELVKSDLVSERSFAAASASRLAKRDVVGQSLQAGPP